MSMTMDRHRKIRVSVPLAGLALAASLAGCASTDPYHRAGIWTPAGVNDANIAAQVANPTDLARGRGNVTGTVRSAATAVDRLWQGAPPRQQGQGQQQANPFAPRQGGPGETQR